MITYGSTTLTSYNSIVRTEVYYYKSTSATSLSGGSWSTTKPTWENGKYIWQKIRTVYEDGTHTESDPVNITGQQGATGTAAYSYKLNSSDSIIGKTKDGEYTIKKITFSATYKQGTGAVSAYGGRFKIESTTNGSTWKTEYTSSENESSKEFTIPDDIILIKCSLYQSDGTTVLLDIVTVPVVKDGVDAISLRDNVPYYLASDKDTGITRLTQGWTRYRPQLTAEKKYLWVYYVSRYSEGTTEPELIEIKDDLVHFVNNGDESPVESCVVDIEPIQDLHGYDHPWPAGGGKNLLDPKHYNIFPKISNGITFTQTDDGGIQANGTATAQARFYFYYSSSESFDTDVILSCKDATSNYRLYSDPVGGVGANDNKILSANTTLSNTFLYVENGATVNNVVYPMIRLASETDPTFVPYSNICPITGWTGAKVTVSPTTDAKDGTTYSITFPTEADTVYGGTLNVTTGELVVDRAIIASYAGESLPSTWISDRDVYNEGATPTTGAQVCYKLATPITYTLTPQEIIMLCNENNIFADTGQTSISYYNNQTSADPFIDYSVTSAFEYADTAINRATATYGTCSTVTGMAAKVVACPDFVLFNGARIQVTFTNANTTFAPTLNVNSTGAKPIYINKTVTSSSNLLLWTAGSKIEFVYDGTGWVAQNVPYALYGTCSTDASTATKNVTCDEAVICKGTTISVNMTNTNTAANAKMNVGSTVAKDIYANGAKLTTNSRFNWRANTTQKFVFDGQVWRMDDDSVKALATAYITEINNDGIMVHPEDDDTSGWAISDAIQLFKSGISYIKLWIENNIPKIRIGKEDQGHIILDNDSVDIRNDDTVLASFGATSVIGDENDWHQTIAANQITFAKGDNIITYISPDKLYTINAEVADAFYISNYSIRNASDGKLVIGLRR